MDEQRSLAARSRRSSCRASSRRARAQLAGRRAPPSRSASRSAPLTPRRWPRGRVAAARCSRVAPRRRRPAERSSATSGRLGRANATGVERAERRALLAARAGPPARRLGRGARGSSVRDGSKRLLGDYATSSWSPFGRFVVAARGARAGRARARRHACAGRSRGPTWRARAGAARRRTRASRTSPAPRLHVVAGDGTGDRKLDAGSPTWRPRGSRAASTYWPTSRRTGRVRVVDADSGHVLGGWTQGGRSSSRSQRTAS